mgnify:CR=1 FL=1|tara:strand:- start:1234 stop:3108 length:1875 start_codon:yes stop_codon:yes gene_type:complete
MVWCVAEIYLFEIFKKTETDNRATKGIISNLLNRLIIMLDEEMLFVECERYLLIRKYIEEFEHKNRGDFMCLYKICKILCESRMIRRGSDIRGYWDPKRRKIEGIYDENTTDEGYFILFKDEFEKKNNKCFMWMFKIFNGKREGKVRRYRRKENIYMIWEYLFTRKNIKENTILRKCLEYRLNEFHKKNRSERFIFLTAAIDIAMYMDSSNFNGEGKLFGKKEQRIGIMKNELDSRLNEEEIIKSVFSGYKKMKIDDYAIDMHTSAGRKMGKNKVDFIASGAVIVDEDTEYFVKEWRDCYNKAKMASFAAAVELRKKKAKKKESNAEEKVEVKKSRAEIRSDKYKRIKKIRGKPNFDDLEKKLRIVDGIDESKITLCSDVTCGNKVMCFEYEEKIWKESRKSMFYNRDYCVVDDCKELFGLRKIGMERILSNFRIEKIDKNKKEWKNNWHKVIIGKDEEKVVYCVMNKITNCAWKVPMEIGVIKHSLVYGVENGGNIGQNRALFKEFVKIGVYRGIFRCSDFNCRNVLVGLKDQFSRQYLVSIDEGDIGKRLDILGGREKWIINGLNADKTIINEILVELNTGSVLFVVNKMKEYKFGDDLCKEVINNWNNLRKDLGAEGVEFE